MGRSICAALIALLSPGIVNGQTQEQQDRPVPFQQIFTVRGVTFSEKQQEQIEKLRTEFVPKLTEIQRERNGIYTQEQRQARRQVMEKAREEGKQGRELQELIQKAVALTEEQQQRLKKTADKQMELVAKIQEEVRSLLTPEQRQQVQRGNQQRPGIRPTHPNVKYGDHERNVMDVWLAKSTKPTPVLVSIHGGGFRGGNKSVNGGLLRQCLDSGISVVAITYRLSQHAIAPAQFHDAARAVQYIRHKSSDWNLDPKRIAATGGSAGAGLSLWLGFHDDLADPDNTDPVLKQSSRLSAMVVYNGQTSYDPRFIRKLFPGTETYRHTALAQLFDVDLAKLDELPKEKYKLFEEVSPITHLTKEDAPALLIYASQMDTPIRNQNIGIHHPRFGTALKEKMDKLGIECRVEAGTPRAGEGWTKLTVDFIKKHFGMKEAKEGT